MRILFIELIGYKRFALNAIHSFVMVPNEKIQLILGTNGSGKSSLLRELSPLPAQSQDYTKDGKKLIHIEHNGSTYELLSTFSPKNEHSFIKNGEELNPGKTMSVQKELVRREFNITPDIHDLIVGNTLFNQMSPTERRQWFTMLSDTNYTFAIGVYMRLKEKARDIQGAIKLNQARAVQEANKLLSPEQEATLRTEITNIREGLNYLLTLKTPSRAFITDLQRDLNQNESLIKHHAKTIIDLRKRFLNLEGFQSLDEIDRQTIERSAVINSLAYTIDQTAKEIESQQDTINTLSKFNLSSLKELDEKLDIAKNNILNIEQLIANDIQFSDPVQAFQALVTVQPNLSEIFSQLEPNDEKRFSRERLQALQEERIRLVGIQQGNETRQLKLLAQKKAQEDEKNQTPTECPKCNHTWQRGFNLETYQAICLQIEQLAKEQTGLIEKLKKLDEDIEQIKYYITVYRSYSDIVRGWPILNPLWENLLNQEILFKTPNSAIYLVERTKGSLTRQIQLITHREELNELMKIKAMTEKDGTEHLEKIQSRVNHLHEELFKQNQMLTKAKTDVARLKTYREIAVTIAQHESQLQSLIQNQTSQSEQLIEEMKQQSLNELIRIVQLDLTKKEQQLSQIDVQKALVDSIQRQLVELEEESSVLKVLVKELSPTDGLIAKGLLGFINNFVRQMNSFIRKVWLYPMELVPCSPDENEDIELDYRFSLKINDDTMIPDIKQASSAMSEVINLAFKIAAMRNLGLSNACLMLDEFSHSMDSAHRSSAFNVISTLITHSDFSQIFIVSHFEDCYGSLKNADIAVLCDKNVVLPQNAVYNRHVTLQ